MRICFFSNARVSPFTPNDALSISAIYKNGSAIEETYYSVGGGFVVKEGEDNSKKPWISVRYDVMMVTSYCKTAWVRD